VEVATDVHRPEEVKVEGDEGGQQGEDHPSGAHRVTHGARLEGVADHQVALDSDDDDEPDGEVTDCITDHIRQLYTIS